MWLIEIQHWSDNIVGVHAVAYAFPKVKIITTAVDEKVNEQFHILPGIGKPISILLSAKCIKYIKPIISQ